MDSSQSGINPTRRTSERRRLKMLGRVHGYRIVNPYRRNSTGVFPRSILNQLRKIPFLSFQSISHLSLPITLSDSNLLNMIEAQRIQQEKFKEIVCFNEQPVLTLEEGYTEARQQQKSVLMEDEPIQAKQEMPISLYEPKQPVQQSIFQCQGQLNFYDQSLNVEIHVKEVPVNDNVLVIQNEYENYFVN